MEPIESSIQIGMLLHPGLTLLDLIGPQGVRDHLALLGAEPTEERVVVDRNRVTGGGVTAGIDFGLVLLAKMRGNEVPKVTQLAMEYDPKPPFDVGSPQTAGPAIVKQAMALMEEGDRETRQVIADTRTRLALMPSFD